MNSKRSPAIFHLLVLSTRASPARCVQTHHLMHSGSSTRRSLIITSLGNSSHSPISRMHRSRQYPSFFLLVFIFNYPPLFILNAKEKQS
ncbi:hypothetical protein F4801DRAFT_80519 [Xylaria longipes]|nr:hypothetical protein F4801DRAFT_80519 [Xylaria longipes]